MFWGGQTTECHEEPIWTVAGSLNAWQSLIFIAQSHKPEVILKVAPNHPTTAHSWPQTLPVKNQQEPAKGAQLAATQLEQKAKAQHTQ